jgi:nitrite reductase/ring-hydroxylating ferredoxin subunit
MLKNFWWPLSVSSEITIKPIRVTALQQEFVLYRLPDGTAQVLSDLCVHRGGALSDGWIEGECIVCPYHGWNFTRDGACVKIPANLPNVPVPRKARVDSYPTVEQNGWVWAFLGDIPERERPPLPNYLEPDMSNRIRVGNAVKWNAPYEKVVAIFSELSRSLLALDGEFAGTAAQISREIASTQTWSASTNGKAQPPKRIERSMLSLLKKEIDMPQVDASVSLFAPCFTVHTVSDTQVTMAHLPIDDHTTRTKWQITRPASATLEETTLQRTDAALERMREKIESGDTPNNLLVEHFKKLNAEAVQRGWGIDTHVIQAEFANIKAVVIPSPARREVPELAQAWVLKEVPTRSTDI